MPRPSRYWCSSTTVCLRMRQLVSSTDRVGGEAGPLPSDYTAVFRCLHEGGCLHGRVTGHPMEVCPLSRGMMLPRGSTPIRLIIRQHSLAPSSFTCRPIGSPCGSLTQREDDRLTTFRVSTLHGLGLACPPVVLCLREKISKLLHLPTRLLAQASQHIWLVYTQYLRQIQTY